MEFLGIGPLELFFILIIALIVLGPKDMAKAGRTIGRLMRKTVLSPTWINLQRRIRALPYEMMREAGLEEEDLRVDIPEANLRFGMEEWTNTQPRRRKPPPRAALAEPGLEPAGEVPEEWLAPPQGPAQPWQTPEENRIQPPPEPEDVE